MDKIAIVILNWNGREMLYRYLSSVVRYSCNEASIYIADNASTDDSMAFIAQHFPHCKTLILDKNYGFAEGYNKALATIEAEYYVLLNSDVEVTHNWLLPLMELMEMYPDVAACQPKLLSIANRDAFEYAGACGGFLDRYGYPFCRGRIFNTIETDNAQYDYMQEVHWATGACLMIRSADYWSVGGLDGRFFAHNEEIDLCWRLRLAGRKIYCEPESVVYHVGGGTLPKANPMKTYLNFRNNLTMLYKNLHRDELRHVMRVRWLLDYVAATQTLLVNFNWADCRAIWKARRDFRRWRHNFDDDRRQIQQNKKTTDKNINGHFSLLWQYYVKARKLFSQLPMGDERLGMKDEDLFDEELEMRK